MHFLLHRLGGTTVAAAVGLCLLVHATANAAILPGTTANGVAKLTYDRAAWATSAPSADYTTISGVPTGASGSTADAVGQRWMFPQRFEGTNWVAAAFPADYLIPLAQNVPLPQPSGGFALPVNSYGVNSFAAGHEISDYDSTSNPGGLIGLGGSMRVGSDFNEPGASVWWEHLALQQNQTDMIWRLVATTGAGQGSIFELTSVVADTVGGRLRLSADYKWGDTDWLQFLQDANGHLDTQAILGHIELTPVPEPTTVALLILSLASAALIVRRAWRGRCSAGRWGACPPVSTM